MGIVGAESGLVTSSGTVMSAPGQRANESQTKE